MLKQTRYYFAALLLWPSRVAEAQGYAPEQTAPSSSAFIYIVVIGIVGVALFFLYRFVSKRIEETPQSPPRMQPKTQPAAKPITVPAASSYVPGSIFISYRRDDSADITGRIYDRLIQHFSLRKSFSRTWTRSRWELILDII